MRTILLAAATVLAMTGAARGEVVGAWSVAKLDGLCAAKAAYNDETSLVFGLQPDGFAGITIINKRWRIPEGQYPVKVWVDRAPPQDMTAVAGGQGITVTYAMSESSFNLISKGAKLFVRIGDYDHWFDLKGSAAMMAALVRCAGILAQNANPFAGPVAPPAPAATRNPFQRL